jgi:hypothetical protein
VSSVIDVDRDQFCNVGNEDANVADLLQEFRDPPQGVELPVQTAHHVVLELGQRVEDLAGLSG